MREGYAELADVKLWYWDTGGDGDPVVLCHPASQATEIWAHQRAAFSAKGYRVIAYARRGHGKSELGPKERPGTTTGDLADLLDHLGLDRVHLLGAAAGGITATAFAVANPERVGSLVLAGTIVSPAEDDWKEMYARLGIAHLHGAVSAEFLELGPSYRASNGVGTRQFSELSAAGTPNGRTGQPSGVRVTWAALEALRVPVLLITGEADLYAPPPLMRLVAGHIRDHRLETMREIGHAPYWEAPEAFNTLVLGFLGKSA